MVILEKLAEWLLTFIVLPLIKDGAARLVAYFRKLQAEGKTNKEIDAAVDTFEKSTTREEQRNALKEIVTGVRRRRANR